MTTYATIQVLGTVVEITPIDDDARHRVDRHLARFVEEAAKVGVTQDAMNLFLDDLVLVRLTIRSASEQTPGELAGLPLETR